MRGGPTYAARLHASLCSNGHPAIQLKYMYSTLLLALLFGRVVYASATFSYFYVVFVKSQTLEKNVKELQNITDQKSVKNLKI
jgi:hypothetical protein